MSRSLPAFVVAALLAACGGNQPPPAPATTSGGSADATAYDAQPEPPVGTTSNTVAAGSQDATPPLPPMSSSSSPTPRAAGIDYPVQTFFVPGYPNIIEIQIRDKQGASEVSLVPPDGNEIDAYQLDTTTQVASTGYRSGPSFGVGVAGGSGGDVGAGIGIGFPLFGFGSSSPPQQTEVLTRARVRIPDAAAYRADYKQWVIRVLFDAGQSTERRMEMAAPPPPV